MAKFGLKFKNKKQKKRKKTMRQKDETKTNTHKKGTRNKAYMLLLFIFCYPLETLNYGERSLVLPLPIYPKNIRQVQTTNNSPKKEKGKTEKERMEGKREN